MDGLGQARQPVHAGDVDVLNATLAQLGQHRQPELGAFVLREPQAQHLFLAAQTDAQHHRRRRVDHLLVLLHLHDDPIQPTIG